MTTLVQLRLPVGWRRVRAHRPQVLLRAAGPSSERGLRPWIEVGSAPTSDSPQEWEQALLERARARWGSAGWFGVEEVARGYQRFTHRSTVAEFTSHQWWWATGEAGVWLTGTVASDAHVEVTQALYEVAASLRLTSHVEPSRVRDEPA